MPLSLVAVLLILILYIQPMYSEVRQLQKAIGESKTELASAQKQTSKLATLANSLQSMEEKKLVDVALPADGDQEDYLAELYQRAARSGIIMSNITFTEGSGSVVASYLCGSANTAGNASATSTSSSPSASGASASANSSALPACAKNQSVAISVMGNWDQILNFLKYITDSNRVANVTGVTLTPSTSNQGTQQGASSDILNATVNLVTFYKTKSETSNPATILALANGSGFDNNSLQKLKDIVYAPYEVPTVTETGERNIFK